MSARFVTLPEGHAVDVAQHAERQIDCHNGQEDLHVQSSKWGVRFVFSDRRVPSGDSFGNWQVVSHEVERPQMKYHAIGALIALIGFIAAAYGYVTGDPFAPLSFISGGAIGLLVSPLWHSAR